MTSWRRCGRVSSKRGGCPRAAASLPGGASERPPDPASTAGQFAGGCHQAVRDPGPAEAAVAVVKALGIAVVLGRDPVEPNVTVIRSVDEAGVEERGAHAMVSEGQIDEEVVHDQDAIGDQCIDTRIQAGETLKSAIRVGDQ